MSDLGLTHVAIEVSDIDRSITFYSKYAQYLVIHRRTDEVTQSDVAWISDLTRRDRDCLAQNAERERLHCASIRYGVQVLNTNFHLLAIGEFRNQIGIC